MPDGPGGRPGLQRRADHRPDAAGGRAAGRPWRCSRSWGCPPTPATTSSTSGPCSTPARRRWAALVRGVRRPAARRRRRPAAPGRPPALQLRGGGRRGAGSSASSPRPTCPNYREFYEAPPVHPAATRPPRERDRRWRGQRGRARSGPGSSSRSRSSPAPDLPRRDLRGPLGARPALVLRRAGRGHRAAQPSASNITVGKADYRRQLVASQSARCLAAYLYSRGRPGRVDHRPGLGRPRADLRERHPAGRVASASPASPSSSAPSSTSSGSPRSACARRPSARRSSARSASWLTSARCPCAAGRCRARGRLLLRARLRALPLRPGRPGHAATSAAPRSTRSRCRGWPSGSRLHRHPERVVIGVSGGLDSTQALLVCAQAMDRLGLPAPQHPRLHHAGLRHQRPHPRPGPRA